MNLEVGFWVYLFYIVWVILGLVWHPFWYGLLLTYFVYMSEILNKVLKALLNPYKEILNTFGLLIGIIYLFTIIYYSLYSNHYPNDTCHSIWYCWITNIDQTWKNDAGISGFIAQEYAIDGSNVKISYLRFLIDNLFNFIVLMLIA